MGSIGNLAMKLSVSSGDFAAGLGKAGSMVQNFAGQVQGAFSSLGSLASGPIATFATVAGAIGLVANGIKRAADLESISIAYETLTGDAEAAGKAIADIKKLAAATPFESPELLSAGKQLLAFGVSADKVGDTLGALGDIAALSDSKIGELAGLFGKVSAAGKVSGEVVQSFADRGIDLIGALGSSMGKTRDEIKSMVSDGKAGFDDFKRAIEGMVNAGGRFHNGTEKMSRGIKGLASTIADNVGDHFGTMGEAIISGLRIKDIMGALAQLPGGFEGTFGTIANFIYSHNPLRGLIEVAFAAKDSFAALFTEFGPLLQPAFDALSDLGKYLLGFSSKLPSVREIALAVFEGIATAVANAVDTMKVISGAVGKHVVAPLTEGMATVGRSTAALLSIAGTLPDKLGGDTFRKAAVDAAVYSVQLSAISKGSAALGGQLLETKIGESAEKVHAAFKRIQEAVEKTESAARNLGTTGSDALRALAASAGAIASEKSFGLGIFEEMQSKLERLRKEIATKTGSAPTALPLPFDDATGKFKTAADGLKALQAEYDALAKKAAAATDFADIFDLQMPLIDLRSQLDALKAIAPAYDKIRQSAEELTRAAIGKLFADARTPLEKFASGMGDLDKFQRMADVSARDLAAATGKLIRDFETASKLAEFPTSWMSSVEQMRHGVEVLAEKFRDLADAGKLPKLDFLQGLDLGKDWSSMKGRLEDLRAAAERVRDAGQAAGATPDQQRKGNAAAAFLTETKELERAAQKTNLASVAEVLQATAGPTEKLGRRLQTLREAFETGVLPIERYGAAIGQAVQEYSKLARPEIDTTGLAISDAFSKRAAALRDTFVQLAKSGELGAVTLDLSRLSKAGNDVKALSSAFDDLLGKLNGAGVDPAVAERLRPLLLGFKGELQKLQDAANLDLGKVASQAIAANQTPLDKLKVKLQDLTGAALAGKLSWKQYWSAVGGGLADLNKTGVGEVKLPPALLAGSAEEVSFRSRFEAGRDTGANQQEQVAANTKAALDKQDDQLRLLKNIYDALGRLGVIGVASASP
jgi:tape measure domain-containing protein